MTRKLPILATVLGLITIATLGAGTTRPLTLGWRYDSTNYDNPDSFNLYTTTNPALPLTNWSLIISVTGTARTVTFPVEPGRAFFVLTSSNFWGEQRESVPSNTASVPSLPGYAVNMELDLADRTNSKAATNR